MNIKQINLALLAFMILGLMPACNNDDDVIPDIPPSGGTTLTLNGGAGGAAAQNSVFVDFSTDRQDSIVRTSWDLAFYSGSDFRVRLNNFAGAAAIGTDYTSLSDVSSSNFDIASLAVGQGQGTLALIDDPSGAVNGTVIPAIAANDADNKVYIVSARGGTAPELANVYKVRVTRSGTTSYTLEYAQLDATSSSTIQVTKDTDYNYSFVSFTSGREVSVEPEKANWDIVWSYSMYFTATFPYPFSDLVFINHLGGVTAAEVLAETVTYEDFSEAHISSVTFDNSRNVIGSNWRATTGTVGVRQDRFYVVRDAAGNVYKLKFNSFHASDGGMRGYPEIEYELVRRG